MENYPVEATEKFDNAKFHRRYCLSFVKKFINGKILEIGAGCGSFTKDYIKSTEKTEISLSNDASENLFFEIVPLTEGVELITQKDLSSLPLKDINFPNTVYIIVDKGLELKTKFLKDFPEWQFLPMDDLKRKTIQIYFDLKNAKRDCTKDQKVIKVPNTNVFNIVSPILISRGITRIICEDQLIAL